MLITIECTKFRVGRINFHDGLNVVLGDDEATNSIGKSTLLMIIDFAFGGGSLLDHNKDIVAELGHHSYKFTFAFGKDRHTFERFTDQPDVVFAYDGQGTQNAMPIAKYNALLKAAYKIESEDLSFRSLVGLYSRVWGKENNDVHRPLHVVKSQAARECVDVLIKTFEKYSKIRNLAGYIAAKEEEKKALRLAFKNRLLPKIGKRQHDENKKKIQRIESEIQDIKNHLARYAANINQLVDQKMLELKSQRDDLLAARTRIKSRLLRTQKNIVENRHIKSQHFSALIGYFPEINTDRLAEVEEFHNGVAKLLRAELRESEAQLTKQLVSVDAQIAAIDERMSSALTSVAQPSEIIDRVQDLSNTWSQARGENDYYERTENLSAEVAELTDQMAEIKFNILAEIQLQINSKIAAIVSQAFGDNRKSPTLFLSESNYEYQVFEDTGTGTAYYSLILLDIAVFSQTFLPCVSHDSYLFKNIENGAVSKLIDIYHSIPKQSFISIDEASKYGANTAELLDKKSVVKLSNSNVLYIKDWRRISGKDET